MSAGTTEVTVPITFDIGDVLRSRAVAGYDQYDREIPGGSLADTIREEVIARVVAKVVKDLVTKKFTDTVERAVANQVNDAVTEALNGEFQPTDSYGHPKGEKTSLRQMIEQRIDGWAKERARDSFSSSESNLHAFIRQTVGDAVKKDVNGALADARKQVNSAVQEKVAAALAREFTGLKD